MIIRSLFVVLVFVIGFSVSAMAQTGKPGERLIYDDRVPEAPQLDNRIFDKPKVLKRKKPEKPLKKSDQEEAQAATIQDETNTERDEEDANTERPTDIVVMPNNSQATGGTNSDRIDTSSMTDAQLRERLEQEEAEMLRNLGNNSNDMNERKLRDVQKQIQEEGKKTAAEINRQIQEKIRQREENSNK